VLRAAGPVAASADQLGVDRGLDGQLAPVAGLQDQLGVVVPVADSAVGVDLGQG
jgi:hypothetical protein